MDEIDQLISGGGVAAAGGSGGIPANFNAETAENDQEIEMQFAVTCIEQSETYLKLISQIRPSTLKRLTKWDDEIMESFEKHFPELQNDEKLKNLSEAEMKSKEGKTRWRNFMMPFEKTIDEFNFGTLIRANVEGEYTEENSIFGYRTQFYAIEIARNRRGLNDAFYEKQQQAKA